MPAEWPRQRLSRSGVGELLAALRERKITPGESFIRACDQKFTNEDVTDEGDAFTRDYFNFSTGLFLGDYQDTLAGARMNLYAVSDTWECYDQIAPVIGRRYAKWSKRRAASTQQRAWWRRWAQ